MPKYANKVVYGTTVLVDLTSDTVTPECLLEGYTAHGADGAPVVGTVMRREVQPYEYDYLKGYVSGASWTYQDSVNNHTDFYEVIGGHRYILSLGSTVGTRFRATVIDTDPVGTTLTVAGTSVVNATSPKPNQQVTFTAAADGYLAVTKDNVGTSGLKSYLIDVTIVE